ncbi:MAG: DUF1080 domain-containing protein [bacterium]|nr:DUF1080 domain-containing protein [bacterium]
MERGRYVVAALALLMAFCLGSPEAAEDEGWLPLFDGKSLDGWKVNENPQTFSVKDGEIVVKGNRSHMFYVGPVANADFQNFEFKADVMTKPGANSGIYLHTKFQESGWPVTSYESQVNQTHGDPKKSGGLYNVVDVFTTPVKDNEWYTHYIMVKGKHVIVKLNDKVVVDYQEPEDLERKAPRLSRGTFALQGHDPGSEVHYKNIVVKLLPDNDGWACLFNGMNLDGWEQLNGTAPYEVKDGAIVGTTAEGSPNSFLCTKKHFADFELEFEVNVDPRLNSGVQFRSNSLKEYQNGRVHGYQVEIATDNPGRIYDEARRGRWLDEDTDPAKTDKAFKVGEWNKYRVLCVGDSIKTWVNGTPIADTKDSMTDKGFIGLQVHSFQGDSPAQVSWRNIRIKELSAEK